MAGSQLGAETLPRETRAGSVHRLPRRVVWGYPGEMRPRDTHPDAYQVQVEAYRRMDPARRVRLAFEMSERAREIAIAGVMAREPGIGRDAARARVLRTILGAPLFEAAYGERGRV